MTNNLQLHLRQRKGISSSPLVSLAFHPLPVHRPVSTEGGYDRDIESCGEPQSSGRTVVGLIPDLISGPQTLGPRLIRTLSAFHSHIPYFRNWRIDCSVGTAQPELCTLFWN